jgi:hypothetical protein
MVETWSKTRSVKDLAYGVAQRRRGAARLHAVENDFRLRQAERTGIFGCAPSIQEREGLDWNPQRKQDPSGLKNAKERF